MGKWRPGKCLARSHSLWMSFIHSVDIGVHLLCARLWQRGGRLVFGEQRRGERCPC